VRRRRRTRRRRRFDVELCECLFSIAHPCWAAAAGRCRAASAARRRHRAARWYRRRARRPAGGRRGQGANMLKCFQTFLSTSTCAATPGSWRGALGSPGLRHRRRAAAGRPQPVGSDPHAGRPSFAEIHTLADPRLLRSTRCRPSFVEIHTL
jgi:hypothetical protein